MIVHFLLAFKRYFAPRDDNLCNIQVNGDSAVMVGNEAQMGFVRDSSDDPATAYSLGNPKLFDPAHNKIFQSSHCIEVVKQEDGKRVLFGDYAAEKQVGIVRSKQ